MIAPASFRSTCPRTHGMALPSNPAHAAVSALNAILLPVLLALALLAGCGPGVGGTGTGESGLAAYGASAAPVCTSDFADLLACPSGPAAQPVTAIVYAADVAEGGTASRHLARFEGASVELELRCERLRFSGTWGTAPGLGTRYYGELRDDAPGAPARAASLVVERDAGEGLRLILLGDDGSIRAGPLVLTRVAAPTPPAPC